jgi:tetratricopeptide (TPR) repeat protein
MVASKPGRCAAHAAWGRGDIRRAVDLGPGRHPAAAPTPGVLALIQATAQAARALAAAGERRQALQALDEAARLAVQAAGDPEREPPWVYFADEDRLEVQRAIALAELGEHRQAADLFRAAIGRLPAQFVRDRGTYLARLATVLARAGELEEASATVFEARDLAAGTGSVRTLREVDRAERAIAA